MAPTILTTKNLRFVIYPKDHHPPHVHVIGGEYEAKFTIDTLRLIANYGFHFAELVEIKKFISDYQSELMEAWDEWQNK